MPGLADYLALEQLNHATGAIPLTSSASRYLALLTAAPTSDAGTGGTEVSGGAYARVQVAGELTAGAGSSGTTVVLGAAAPAWLAALVASGAGVNVYNVTTSTQIGTIASGGASASSANVTLTATAGGAVSSGNALAFSAFPQATASSGAEPSTTPATVSNGAIIPFAQSTASWGTIVAWGLYDALTGGNLYYWDCTGAGKWSPFSCNAASPGVVTVNDQTFVNGGSIVVSAKFGGALPTLSSGSWSGLQTVAGVSGNTFNVGLNTTAAGDGMVRPVTQYTIGISTTVSFAAGALTLTAA